MPGAARSPLYLHVGVPKSGTTYLQSVLAGNREALRGQGLVYPFVRPEAMFAAAVEMREVYDEFGLEPAEVNGTWQRLCDRVRRYDGAGLISHEILGAASPAHIARLAGTVADLDLHIVLTARDPVRQAASHWQEHVKNGATYPFAALADEVLHPDPETPAPSGFWQAQDLADVLARWGAAVPADHLHVVVSPRRAADPAELWRRFAAVPGIDPGSVDLGVAGPGNPSLGVAQVALLRQVNAALAGRVPPPHYGRVVKRYFAETVLPRGSSPRAAPPPPVHRRLTEVARDWVDRIEAAGHPTYGDLSDLVPEPPSAAGSGAETRHPDDVAAEEMLDGVPGMLADLLAEVADLRSATREPAEPAEKDGPAERDGPAEPPRQPDGLASRVRRRVRRG